ncbi:hypothetical protein HBI56_198290 [Parastagonospora nodorum]|uniref:Uncharacterized protein n=1 Tax=Phaeosphaeria nodorum (strain SN15 / ATCC MYA-4574 / FGSC 10173) TaxID=321614 RepID=A0A7U2FAK0_PHANO|nr:hypothetical protein HBH56_203000 [Parastagonospora nodorum]QRD01757.1 hypothetical protein JI435_144990 [Parastagonospora nodorum SN15]KAH3923949.1 hypothetical protein HBH54_201870 [Parastagonospora nodorum]KAH3941513.1 hypothetical protein HBH53_202180 [Parastagonospora nodorum]KAH3959561.1 hypothetical protein HBH51_198330 [Parastagonospora nodorum]
MPAERRTFTATRPVKTERTHEENQERAYIAASRRSDRSLEARIESARRASEIHKKRTGRALRVTEQDVINEEMYEEEDDDLPTQYQRLNAHLHTTSVMFNKKLHDYIATQHGVRNMFMSQYQNPSFQQYGGQFQPNAGPPGANNWLNPSMMPPQQFNPASPQQGVTQQAQPVNNSTATQQGFRQSPYQIPQRVNTHGRALSIQLPQSAKASDPSTQSAPGGITTPQDSFRRMSLPPHGLEQQAASADGQSRPALSRGTTAQSPHGSVSPQTASPRTASGQVTPQLHQDTDTPASYPFNMAGYPFSSQVLSANPLALSMPPESQQFIGSALDPNDPRTALFMAGSDNLPQYAPTYTYNPNFSGKLGRTTLDDTLAPGAGIKTENVDAPSSTIPSEGFFNTESLFTPGNEQYNAFFDFQGSDFAHTGDEQGDNFVNWD